MDLLQAIEILLNLPAPDKETQKAMNIVHDAFVNYDTDNYGQIVIYTDVYED